MKKYVEFAFVSIVSVLVTLSIISTNTRTIDGGTPLSMDAQCECSTEDITNMYVEYIDKWKADISKSFDEAESQVFKKNPIPDVDGPNPDPNKCPCKGTGVITHGDGHKTTCPYHGKKGQTIHTDGLIIRTY